LVVAPINNLLVHIDKRFNDELLLKSGVTLHVATNLDPTEHVNVIGTVLSLPRTISSRIDYKGFSTEGIEVGDKVILRYDVVYSIKESAANRYKNEMVYKGKSYWRADIQKIFGVIKPDGTTKMVNGYLMLEPFARESSLHIPGHVKRLTRAVRSMVWHSGTPLTHLKDIGAELGDLVFFNPRIAQKYTIGDKQYVIIKQSQVAGLQKQEQSDEQTQSYSAANN
jgi:hypothetical protein